eukprot:GHVO01003940.1.p1 GENE.GHVO01003940.1~~GHVO01003940.1.p1  ORF type:complete len:564 (+),score=97.65 GHVO01003940.1:129-1820(+)
MIDDDYDEDSYDDYDYDDDYYVEPEQPAPAKNPSQYMNTLAILKAAEEASLQAMSLSPPKKQQGSTTPPAQKAKSPPKTNVKPRKALFEGVDDLDVQTPTPGGRSPSRTPINEVSPIPQDEPTSPPPEVVENDYDNNLLPLNVVVIGHVDAGKSTLVGRLLVDTGNFCTKTFRRYQRESEVQGKSSFRYAWILDEGKDERDRGITYEVCAKHFETPNRAVTFHDAPGHSELVPNALKGMAQADAALLVVDASDVKRSIAVGGQAREHLQLARALGISCVVVAINKLDMFDFQESSFDAIVSHVESIVQPLKFPPGSVKYVPISAYNGINLTTVPFEWEAKLKSWWTGGTLIDAIDALPSTYSEEHRSATLIGTVSDCSRIGTAVAVTSTKLEAGRLSVGDQITVLPSNQTATVKSLTTRGQRYRSFPAGTYIDAAALTMSTPAIGVGSVLVGSDPHHGVRIATRIQAKLLGLSERPVIKSMQLMCYVHLASAKGTIVRIRKEGEKQTRKVPVFQKGEAAVVDVRLDRPIALLIHSATSGCLSRVVFRDRETTLAAGMVVEIKA